MSTGTSTIANPEIIPILSSEIEIHSFDKEEYVIWHKILDYRVKINLETKNLLSFIDGVRSLKQICEQYERHHNIKISEKEIQQLLFDKLINFGIITSKNNQIRKKEREKHLWISFIFLNPSIVHFLTKKLLFLFSPIFFCILLPIMFLFICFVITLNYNAIFSNANKLFSFKSIYFLVVSLFCTIFHEIGHASACRKFGANPGGIGFGFYLFIPVMFSDVSDAWRLTPKKRIMVNLGGIYFEMILVSFLLLGYYIFNEWWLLILPCILIINTLQNLNPFIKYDGYWILSDAIGIPNLHKNANKTFIYFVNNLIKGKINKLFLKDYFLISYEILSKTYIFFILITVLIINPNSILFFPINIFVYIKSLIVNFNEFSFSKTSSFFLPLIFYIITFQLIVNFVKNKLKSRNC